MGAYAGWVLIWHTIVAKDFLGCLNLQKLFSYIQSCSFLALKTTSPSLCCLWHPKTKTKQNKTQAVGDTQQPQVEARL